jgi:hypothetical protein
MNPTTDEKEYKKSNSFTTKLFGKIKVKSISVTSLGGDIPTSPKSPKESDRQYTYESNNSINSAGLIQSMRAPLSPNIMSPSPLSPDIVPIRMNEQWHKQSQSFSENSSQIMGLSRNPTAARKVVQIDTSKPATEGEESRESPLASPSLKHKLFRGFTNMRRPSNLHKASSNAQENDSTPPDSPVVEGSSPFTPDLPTAKQIYPPEPRNKIQIDVPKPSYATPPPLLDESFTESQSSPVVKPKGIKVTIRGIENLQLDMKPTNVRDTYSPSPSERHNSDFPEDFLKLGRKPSKIDARSFSSTSLDMEQHKHRISNTSTVPSMNYSTSKLLDDKKSSGSPKMAKKESHSLNELSNDVSYKDLSMSGVELANRVVIGKSSQFQIDKPKSTYPPSLSESDSLISLEGKKTSTASSERASKFKGMVKGIENVLLDTTSEKPEQAESHDILTSLDSISPQNVSPKRKKAPPQLNLNTQPAQSTSTEEHSDGPLTALMDRKHRFSFMVGGMPPVTDDETSLDTIKLTKKDSSALADCIFV